MKESDLKGNIHSIEHFGTVDGPGIRYVLFFQGCTFKCKYCHNRDTWSYTLNKEMTASDIINDYNKYIKFYKNGGITVSGGEPTRQLSFLKELFKTFKNIGVHTVLDTSAACYLPELSSSYLDLLEFTDLVLLDIKQINNEKHKKMVGAPNTNVLSFARLLSDINKPAVIRYVLIPGYTDDLNDLKSLRLFLDTLSNITKIEVLPYHNNGKEKWIKMGLTYPLEKVKVPSKEQLDKAVEILTENYKYLS